MVPGGSPKLEGIDPATGSSSFAKFDMFEAFPNEGELIESDLLKTIYDKMRALHDEMESNFGTNYKDKIDEVLSEYVAKHINCNTIFALFAIHTSLFVSKEFFKEILIFMGLFRKVVNDKGWEKFKEYNPNVSANDTVEYCED